MKRRLKTETEQREALGARIRERRMLAGQTLDAVAAKLEMSIAQVARYETGENQTDMPTLVKLADALKCDVADLLADFLGKETLPPLGTAALHVAHLVNDLPTDHARKFARVLIEAVAKHERERGAAANGR